MKRKPVAFCAQLLALFMVVSLALRPGFAEPGDVLKSEVPVIGSTPPKPRDLNSGDSSVSTQTGAFQYSYPITVPPGRLGVEPKLALAYSSQASVYGGIAAGWSLDLPELRKDFSAGLSGYTLVSSMAGGHRLFQVTESAPTDTVTTFRAEDDSSYTQYESLGTAWRARTTDGSLIYFNELDHYLTPAGVPDTILYASSHLKITHTEDPFGNRVDYYWRELTQGTAGGGYFPEVLERAIDHIDYTANPGASLPAFARVSFQYATATYCAGSFVPLGAQLTMHDNLPELAGARQLDAIHIGTLAGSTFTERRTIALGYDGTARTCDQRHGTMRLLTSIAELAVSPSGATSTRPPVTFSYGAIERSFGLTKTVATGGGPLQSGLNRATTSPSADMPTLDSLLIDLDGDGRLDQLVMGADHTARSVTWRRNTASTNGDPTFGLQVLSNFLPAINSTAVSGKYFSLAGEMAMAQNDTPPATYAVKTKTCITDPNTGAFLAYRFLDMNGDGLPDLVTGLSSDYLYYHPYPLAATTAHPAKSGDALFMNDWGLGTCPSQAQMPGYGCPLVSPTDVESRLTCTDPGHYGLVCQVDAPKMDLLFGAADSAPCDTRMGGSTIVYMGLDPQGGGNAVWANYRDGAFSDLPPDEGGSGSCKTAKPPRRPEQYCGRYPWRWYQNLGNGVFAGLNSGPSASGKTIFAPMPLEPSVDSLSLGGNGAGITSSGHAIIDLDGDGYLDAVSVSQIPSDATSAPHGLWYVWRGDGLGNFLAKPGTGQPYPWLVPQNLPISKSGCVFNGVACQSGATVQLLDMNGDGLPDLLSKPTATDPMQVYLNTGSGFRDGPLTTGTSGQLRLPLATETVHHSQIDKTYPNDPNNFSGTRSDRLWTMDLDGDGRIDVLDQGVDATRIATRVAINSGSGQAASTNNVDVDLGLGSVIDGVLPERLDSQDLSQWALNQEHVDIDGDGVVDLITEQTNSFQYLTDQHGGIPNHMLYRVDNGAGGTVDVRYTYLTDPAAQLAVGQPTQASPMWVVRSLTTTNAQTATWPAVPGHGDSSLTTYKYGSPVSMPDTRGKLGFRGFDQVEATGPSGARTVSKFDYAVDWSGRLVETDVLRDASTSSADRVDTTAYGTFFLFGTAARSFLPTDTKHYTCSANQTVTQCMPASGATVVQTRTTYTAYPSSSSQMWGRTLEVMTRIPNQVSVDDKKVIYTNYPLFDANTYRFRVGSIRKQEGTLNTQGQIIWSRAAEHVDDWDATKRVVADTLDLVNDTHNAITYFSHDMATGLLTGRRKPMQASANKWVTYAYEPSKVYVQTTTNELGHVVTTSYDPGTGALLSTKGPNSAACGSAPGCQVDAESRTVIDGFGRPTETWVTTDAAGGGYLLQQTGRTTYFDAESPQRVKEESRLDFANSNYGRTDTTFDGLGRVLIKTTFNQNAGADQRALFHYDAPGNLAAVEVTDPSATTDVAVRYDFTYDALGRLTQALRPAVAGSTFRTGYTVSHNGLVDTRSERWCP